METTALTIKDKVHELINTINDIEILKAVHVLLKSQQQESFIPEEHWREIEKDDKDFENGSGKNYSWADVETIISKKKK